MPTYLINPCTTSGIDDAGLRIDHENIPCEWDMLVSPGNNAHYNQYSQAHSGIFLSYAHISIQSHITNTGLFRPNIYTSASAQIEILITI